MHLANKGSDDSLNIENELLYDQAVNVTEPDSVSVTDLSSLLDNTVSEYLCEHAGVSHSKDDDDDVNSAIEVPKVLWQTDIDQAKEDMESDPLFDDVSQERKEIYLSHLEDSHTEREESLSHVVVNRATDHIGQFDNVNFSKVLHHCETESQEGYKVHSAMDVARSNIVPPPVVDDVITHFSSHRTYRVFSRAVESAELCAYSRTDTLSEAHINIPHVENVTILPLDQLYQNRFECTSNSQAIVAKLHSTNFFMPVRNLTIIDTLVSCPTSSLSYNRFPALAFSSSLTVYAAIEHADTFYDEVRIDMAHFSWYESAPLVSCPTSSLSYNRFPALAFSSSLTVYAAIEHADTFYDEVRIDMAHFSWYESAPLCEQNVDEWEVYENPRIDKKKLKRFHPRVKMELRQGTMPLFRSAEPYYENPGAEIPPLIWQSGRLNVGGTVDILAPLLSAKTVFLLTQDKARTASVVSLLTTLSEDGSCKYCNLCH